MINQERLKIWQSLSQLFLDTEIDDLTYKYIVRTIGECNFSLPELEDILWSEVYPVLAVNLRSITGEWEGWSDEWLLENLSVCNKPDAIRKKSSVANEIQCCWLQIIELYKNTNTIQVN